MNTTQTAHTTHTARKRFGQHFLTDAGILYEIIAHISPSHTDHMLEIGPGMGALTQHLLPHLAHLHVVEIDRDLAQGLQTGPWAKQLTVWQQDVLTLDVSKLPGPLRVVGNLPYNVSSPILFAMLGAANHVRDQHFMLQKEVIDRMVAEPSTATYGRLSVMMQAFYDLESLMDVPPEAFDPPPKVMSSVVRMVPKPAAIRNSINLAKLTHIVASAFGQRRKMLRNTWKTVVPEAIAAQAGIDLTQRAEDISVFQYVKVCELMRT